MAKLDQRKENPYHYEAPRDPVMVEVPPMNYLMVDGEGDPRTSIAYQQSVDVLYGLSFTIKFALKKEGTDYAVAPLEGLWWSDDMNVFVRGEREDWKWTSLIMQPPLVAAEHIDRAIVELRRKKDPPALSMVRFKRFDEGLCAQVMHVGLYSEEGPTIERLHMFIAEQGCDRHGKHHEIYLGDPRRTRPEKLRTIIRQPVRMKG